MVVEEATLVACHKLSLLCPLCRKAEEIFLLCPGYSTWMFHVRLIVGLSGCIAYICVDNIFGDVYLL